jgi:anti-sigma regulatory factor (Ser/Thr protein kinase)
MSLAQFEAEMTPIMTGSGTHTTEERLTLRSRLSEMSQVPVWIERLAPQHAIPADTQFAMNLCLEEVLSNVIRHGYGGQSDRYIVIQFLNPKDGYFVFLVEDEASHFNPLEAPELPAIGALDEERVGGLGIRLLRQFASALEYQATPTGNRLTMGFSVAGSVNTAA